MGRPRRPVCTTYRLIVTPGLIIGGDGRAAGDIGVAAQVLKATGQPVRKCLNLLDAHSSLSATSTSES